MEYETKKQTEQELKELVPGPSMEITPGPGHLLCENISQSLKQSRIHEHYSEIQKLLLTKMGQQLGAQIK